MWNVAPSDDPFSGTSSEARSPSTRTSGVLWRQASRAMSLSVGRSGAAGFSAALPCPAAGPRLGGLGPRRGGRVRRSRVGRRFPSRVGGRIAGVRPGVRAPSAPSSFGWSEAPPLTAAVRRRLSRGGRQSGARAAAARSPSLNTTAATMAATSRPPARPMPDWVFRGGGRRRMAAQPLAHGSQQPVAQVGVHLHAFQRLCDRLLRTFNRMRGQEGFHLLDVPALGQRAQRLDQTPQDHGRIRLGARLGPAIADQPEGGLVAWPGSPAARPT